jgi:hypothetical protein
MENKEKNIGQLFVEIGNNILDESKRYAEINPELQNIFEYTFKSYIEIVRYIQEGKNNINIIDIEKYVFSKIFDNIEMPKREQGNCNIQSQNTGGFNPNSTDGINMELLTSLKNNINKEINDNSNNSMNKFVDKIKEEYKTKE